MNKKVRLSKSVIGAEEKAAAVDVLDREYLGMGEEVRLFEQELQAYLGTSSTVVCVNTGTAALHLAIAAVTKPGDEVLVPSITYVASFQAIAAAGAVPIPCDVTTDKFFIDLTDAEKRMSPRTKAIMPVHYAGDSSGMPAIYEFARRHGLRVVEDAAHSFGGTRGGHKVGNGGDVICFSFDGIKNITSGEGGAIVTADPAVKEFAQDGRLLSVEKDTEKRFRGERSWSFDVKRLGYRFHMSNIMAAIGRAQLRKIDRFSQKRQSLAKAYAEALRGNAHFALLEMDFETVVPHIFVVRVLEGHRNALRAHLAEAGIETGIHYQPNHLLSFFDKGYGLPTAERLAEEMMTLPLHPDLDFQDVANVLQAIELFFRR